MLCRKGQHLFNQYQTESTRFTNLFSLAETYDEQKKLENELMSAFLSYRSHVDHCLECNIDQREPL